MNDLIPPDHPNRCKKTIPNGQCKNIADDGSDFCSSHQPVSQRELMNRKRGQYDLRDVRARERMDDFAQSDAVYSLKEEIATLRLVMERTLEDIKPHDSLSVALKAPMLMDLAKVIEKLVKTSGNMEIKFGALLSKDTVYSLCRQFVEIFTDELRQANIPNYEDIVERSTKRIVEQIRQSKDSTDDKDS